MIEGDLVYIKTRPDGGIFKIISGWKQVGWNVESIDKDFKFTISEDQLELVPLSYIAKRALEKRKNGR